MPARAVSPPRFRLRVARPSGSRIVITVWQRSGAAAGAPEPVFVAVGQAEGLALDVARPLVAAAVRANGYSPERLARPDRPDEPPIDLDEANGARVALALVAVRPLRKLERMEGVVRGIEQMSDEEVLYWFARAMRGPKTRVLRALRILLAKE